MGNKAIILFQTPDGMVRDLEIPLYITARELIGALSRAYSLDIGAKTAQNPYLKAENPIALLQGDCLLSEYGIHNGTTVHWSL